MRLLTHKAITPRNIQFADDTTMKGVANTRLEKYNTMGGTEIKER